MKKVLVVFGTRPEAIKMCPLVLELKKRPEFDVKVCVTGQHREMLDQVLKVFGVEPDYSLDIMKANQDLYDITTNILLKMKAVLTEFKPDVVLVHGDTTTTFASGLAAFYEQIPVGHVEAGLRTYDIYSPFPEEFNRQAIGLVARFHFSPTEVSKENLLKENKNPDTIFVTGNTAIDALQTTVNKNYTHPDLEWAKDSRLILMTAHRRENHGQPLRNIFEAVRRLVLENEDVKVIYPVHLNPKVKDVAEEMLGDLDRVKLVAPLEVIDFHNFINQAYFIMSDSGGIQEEAPSLGKPVLVLRDTTERPEGVDAGTLKLVGTEMEDVYREAQNLLDNIEAYNQMSQAANPYGDGKASQYIADILAKEL